MFRSTLNRIAFVSAILLLSLGIACVASAGGSEQLVCDVGADYALGVENYPEAVRLHAEVVRKRPDDALAHYHLGFEQFLLVAAALKPADLPATREEASIFPTSA